MYPSGNNSTNNGVALPVPENVATEGSYLPPSSPLPTPVGPINAAPVLPPAATSPAPAAKVSDMPISQSNPTMSNNTDVVQTTPNDSDLIEKEWVEKAKKIVDQNRQDPYRQSRELTALKAEYMQKRYNKLIKLSE